MKTGLLLALLSLVPGTGYELPRSVGCTCAQAKLTNNWCKTCEIGYVAGVALKSQLLFDSLDAHGHTVNLHQIRCAICSEAIKDDGFCEQCRIGWFDEEAYFSRLTYHLAKGEAREVSKLDCDVCKINAKNHGWCDSCKLGMVGNVALKDKADFDGASKGYDLMLAMIQAEKRCETCAVAMMVDSSCFYCKITFKDGKKVNKAKKSTDQD